MRVAALRSMTVSLALLALMSIVSLGFFTWRWADDYSFFVAISQTSVFEHIVHGYLTWDGRFLSLAVLLQTLFIRYLPVEYANVFWASCLVLSALLIAEILRVELPLFDFRGTRIIFTALFSVLLWHGMRSHISETVYWATGGVYVFASMMGLMWSLSMLKLSKERAPIFSRNKLAVGVFFVFGILAGTGAQTLSVALFVFGVLLLIARTARDRTRDKTWWTMVGGTFGFLIGSVIVIIAPGNFARAQHGAQSFDISALSLFLNFARVLKHYLVLSVPLVLLAVISALLALCILSLNNSRHNLVVTSYQEARSSGWIEWLERSKWGVAALATIGPLILVPDFLSARTSIFFMILLAVFVLVSVGQHAGRILSSVIILRTQGSTIIAYGALVLLFAVHIAIVSGQIKQASDIKAQITIRSQGLRAAANKGTDAVVERIDPASAPFSLRFNDISEDSNHWINQGVAQYYGLKSIRTK